MHVEKKLHPIQDIVNRVHFFSSIKWMGRCALSRCICPIPSIYLHSFSSLACSPLEMKFRSFSRMIMNKKRKIEYIAKGQRARQDRVPLTISIIRLACSILHLFFLSRACVKYKRYVTDRNVHHRLVLMAFILVFSLSVDKKNKKWEEIEEGSLFYVIVVPPPPSVHRTTDMSKKR